MPKFKIDQTDYDLATTYGAQVLAGSAFAFVAPQEQPEAALQQGLHTFYGLPLQTTRRILPLLPDGQVFPGFKIKPAQWPLHINPVLLTDKEIYRAGQDRVRLLLVAPAWLFGGPDRPQPTTATLVIENNGVVYRNQPVRLNEGGLTLADLGALPQGRYRVYWQAETTAEFETENKPAECWFSSVEYVLAPLQATLQAHELAGNKLGCRLKVERFNQPLTGPVQLELWSGGQKFGTQKVRPELPGIYLGEFKLKSKNQERLEVRVSYQDLVATAVIPNSTKAERQEAVLSALGTEVKVSLMPGPGTREVRGLYLSTSGPVNNSPVTLADPAPASGAARLRWQTTARSARLLLLDLAGKVVEDRDLGEIQAGTELELAVPAPGGFLALGAWIGDKAWEGWASLVVPSPAQVSLEGPIQARPGQTVQLKINTGTPASVYLLVRDSRLAGATPQDRLAASFKNGLEGAARWGNSGYISKPLTELPEWQDFPVFNRRNMLYRTTMAAPMMMASMTFADAIPPEAAMAGGADISMPVGAQEIALFSQRVMYKGGGLAETATEATVRQDFADVAFCEIVQTGPDGTASVSLALPEAITAYKIEAFALSAGGKEWSHARESLEVSQPLWAEFKLPAYVYPGDLSPAVLEVNCDGGAFSLQLFCDDRPVAYKLSGATQSAPGHFQGRRARAVFEARPGRWRAELRDLATGETDQTGRAVEALGKFTSLSRRFQVLLAGQSLDRAEIQALQLRVLPSLDKPFQFLCDATADYAHRCCEQTAAKLLASVAALVAAGAPDQAKYREVILAGVAREKSMFLPGRGFMMYPPEESGGNRKPDEYWGKLAAQHLGGLAPLGETLAVSGLAPDLQQALREAQAMGEAALQAYRIPLVPEKVESGREAYQTFLKKGPKLAEALDYARTSLANQAAQAPKGQVLAREEKAYCASTLLASGDQADLLTAIKAANDLVKDLDGEGRLYSTVDSVALICLLLALRSAGIGGTAGSRVKLDGLEMDMAGALEVGAAGQVQRVEVTAGAALVEVTLQIVEDWNSFRDEVAVGVELVRRGRAGQPLRLGDTVELVVKVAEYIPGLLVHVCLPAALSVIQGGGEVKKFSLDFAGRNELRLPLRATGYTLEQGEHWAVLVRNMFNQEQAGTPGLLLAQVSPD